MLKKAAVTITMSAGFMLAAVGAQAGDISSTVPQAIGPFCPELVRGDRDFAGHGPTYDLLLELVRTTPTAIQLVTTFSARESMESGEHTGDRTAANLTQMPTTLLGANDPFYRYTHSWRPVDGTWQWVDIDDRVIRDSPIDKFRFVYFDRDKNPTYHADLPWFLMSLTTNGETNGIDVNTGTCDSDDTYIKMTMDSLFFWHN